MILSSVKSLLFTEINNQISCYIAILEPDKQKFTN